MDAGYCTVQGVPFQTSLCVLIQPLRVHCSWPVLACLPRAGPPRLTCTPEPGPVPGTCQMMVRY